MRQSYSLQGVYKTPIRAGVIALCLFQTFCVTVSPTQAFWFFHKHKKSDDQLSQPANYSGTPVGQSTVYYMPAGYVSGKTNKQQRRLVPAYMYKNSPPQTVSDYNAQPAKAIIKTFDDSRADTPPSLVPINHIVRVGIGLNLEKAKISVVDGAQVIDNRNGQIIANLPGQSQWIVTRQEDQIVLQPRAEYYNALEKLALAHEDSGAPATIQTVAYYPSSESTNVTGLNQDLSILTPQNLPPNVTDLILPLTEDKCNYTIKAVSQNGKTKGQSGLLALNDRPYRGDFLIQNNKERFNVINILNLEDYLLAVVPSEMPSLWPDEALKAQAIAARSYAVANLGKHASDGYDVKDNTEDQMYLGVKAETEYTNRAVNLTNGLVVKYDGKPICAYFHSAGGGTTEAAENVWHKSLPYLKAVTDFDQDSPMYNWTKNFTADQVENVIPADKDVGKILSVCVSEKSPSGRAVRLLIDGSNNECIISGEAARKYFSLPSTNFNVTAVDNAYIFSGKGFGHGLGLSQWGAKSLASHGYNAAQILCYYYNGVDIGY